jgi:dTDP-4-amino-4,6-dideoxygalactose transaminase
MAKMPFIDLGKQYERLKSEINAALLKAAASGAYINGPEVKELEDALCEFSGAARCVACGNGTDALSLVLWAWGVGPGDAVFCPAFSFIATAEVASLLGATPVFVDIEPLTFNIDPADLEAKIEKVASEGILRPRAVIPVDLFGLPHDFEGVSKVCAKHKLPVLEDAAQGFGGAYGALSAGRLGAAGATSFFPSKPLGCYGDGGAVLTDDEGLADAVKSLRAHGSGADRYLHQRVGVNSRLDTLQAAVLLCKLKIFPEELQMRRAVAESYERELAWTLPGKTPVVPGGRLSAWAQYTLRVPAALRPGMAESLKQKGVPTMIYYPRPLHLQPAFASLGGRAGDLPVSERAAREVMSLPMHPYLAQDDIKLISTSTLEAYEESAKKQGFVLLDAP